MAGRLVNFPGIEGVGFTGLGDPMADRMVLFCHPTAGAAGFDPDPLITSTWGVHLVSFDRPGYGLSQPYPADVHASADLWADTIARYFRRTQTAAGSGKHDFTGIGVVGWREGGLFALALAARHPGLVDRLALVACPALPRLAASDSADAGRWLDSRRLMPPLSGHDTSAFQRRVHRMMTDARLQGHAGVDADLESFHSAMPDPSAVSAETLIVSGRRDEYATASDARWFADALPEAHTFVSERGGSDVIASAWARVLEHVAPAHGRPAA